MNIKDLINWSKLSNHLTGNNNSIRKDKVPNKYKKEVDQLLGYIELWIMEIPIDKKVYTQGHTKGYEDGYKEAKREVTKLWDEINNLINKG